MNCQTKSKLRMLVLFLVISTSFICIFRISFAEDRPWSWTVRTKTFESVGEVVTEDVMVFEAEYSRSRYKSFIHDSPLSKNLVIYRAYYDDRPKKRHHNQTTFFIEIARQRINNEKDRHHAIVGCGVNEHFTDEYNIRIPAEWWWSKGNFFKYEHIYIDCYDLPAKPGDRAFIVYSEISTVTRQEYEIVVDRPIEFPIPRDRTYGSVKRYNTSTDADSFNFTVLTCLKANSNGAPFMPEIIRYQTLIGIDHIVLTILSAYIKDGGLKKLLMNNQEVIQHFIRDGYMSVELWKSWYAKPKKETHLFSESIRKVACSYKYRGTYDYFVPIDSDDFFNPRLPDEKNIKYYLQEYCSFNGTYPIGSCILEWPWYYPGFCGLNEIPANGNVTVALKSQKHKLNRIGHKSVYKTVAFFDASFHDAIQRDPDNFNLVDGYQISWIPNSISNMAHMRNHARPSNKQC